MKANASAILGEDAVSPVIAVILMVAITVVLAATVYLWVSGFGSAPGNIVQASFGVKSIDRPGSTSSAPFADADNNDDTLLLTFVTGVRDYTLSEVSISIDTVRLTNAASGNFYPNGVFAASNWCTTDPGGDGNANWERGATVYLIKASNTAVAGDCSSPSALTTLSDIRGTHQIQVSVRGQIVLDATVEVHDNART